MTTPAVPPIPADEPPAHLTPEEQVAYWKRRARLYEQHGNAIAAAYQFGAIEAAPESVRNYLGSVLQVHLPGADLSGLLAVIDVSRLHDEHGALDYVALDRVVATITATTNPTRN
jgi:hypothetical protein